MKNRIKLALKIILGKDIIVYEENSKKVLAIINGDLDLLSTKCDYAVDKYICENAGEMRYLR